MKDPYDTSGDRTSILGPTIQFKGELQADEDLLIRGTVEGTITHTQRLTIGAEGRVQARINALMVVIEGQVEGDVRADHSVAVRDKAQLTGNIHSPSVTIQEGARFTGHVDMSAGGSARTSTLSSPPSALRTAGNASSFK